VQRFPSFLSMRAVPRETGTFARPDPFISHDAVSAHAREFSGQLSGPARTAYLVRVNSLARGISGDRLACARAMSAHRHSRTHPFAHPSKRCGAPKPEVAGLPELEACRARSF